MSISPTLTPVSAENRIEAMDVLRGFALFGILLVNIKGMVGPLNLTMLGTDVSLTGINYWADAAVYIFGYSKFYTLFSLLFGMGFAVMLARAREAGKNFGGLYLRRLFVLFLFGLVHGTLIWSGDILLTYSLFGLLLLLFFRNTPQSRLPKWSLTFFMIPVMFVLLSGLIGWGSQFSEAASREFSKAMASEKTDMLASIEAQRAAYGHGAYPEIVQQAIEDRSTILSYMGFMGWMILGLFLLGAWFIRSGAIRYPETYPRLYAWMRNIGLPLGLIMTVWSFIVFPYFDFSRYDMEIATANAAIFVGGLMMSLGYMAWIIRGLESPVWAPRLAILAPAGRMALTNYLLQSIIGTLIFYNHGLGFYEQLPLFAQIPFVFAVFALQVMVSKWWLSRFQFGPAEWLWRALTYLRMPPMRIDRPAGAGFIAEGAE